MSDSDDYRNDDGFQYDKNAPERVAVELNADPKGRTLMNLRKMRLQLGENLVLGQMIIREENTGRVDYEWRICVSWNKKKCAKFIDERSTS